MASSSMCGPSNPLQSLKNHSSFDRSLQQDRFRSSHQPASQQFRQTPLSSHPIDHEFEQFLSSSPGPSQQQLRSRPSLQNFAPAPSPQLQQQPPSWAADFQRLQINTPPPVQASPLSTTSGGWGAEFLSQMNAPVAVAQQQQKPTFGNGAYTGMNSGYMGLGGVMMNTYSPAIHSSGPLQSQQSVATGKSAETYTDAEFDQMFEEAAAQQVFDHQEFENFPHREVPQPLQAENLEHQQVEEEKKEENDTSQEDADELARTAGQLVDTLSQDTSKKFQESQFVALMRKLRDKTVRVEDGKMVEV
ncbi:hypothetical protein TWF694_007950 [Orbilia ellipsospora]|uniref:Peroxin 20 n=1 Tax=Orbilia ellipsospora TaxID=2528407 RepID=A0AAV9XKQ2_9PEZI